jgi:hypothetical protein
VLRKRLFPVRPLLAAATLLALTVGCSSDDDPAGPNDQEGTIVGTWNATSFAALGSDFIAGGMTLMGTFTAANTYSFDVTGDQVGVCGDSGVSDCTSSGPYSSTATQVTIDAGEEDEVTFAYTIQGSGAGTGMTWTGTIGGFPVTVVWGRVN